MKRILIFSTAYFPLVGGAEVAMRELTDRLKEYEFDLITATIKPGLEKAEQIGRTRVFRVGFGKAIDKFLLPWTGLRKAEQLHAEKPYDAIWVLMASYAAFGAARFKHKHPDIPMLLTLQEGDPPEYIAKKTRFVKGWFREIFERTDALQTISTFLKDWGISQGFGGELVEVIPNGVDLKRFQVSLQPEEHGCIRKEYGYNEKDVVVITASRLVTKNGVDLLIEALAKLPEHVKLLIAGVGELEDEQRALAASLKLENRVQFAGLVSHDKLPSLMAASDIFCRPSRSEGMGNAFVEAMAVGLPTIGTKVGGIVDIIRDGENGLLIEPESPVAIADAVKRLLDHPELRAALTQHASQTVQTYDWDKLAARMDIFMKKILEISYDGKSRESSDH